MLIFFTLQCFGVLAYALYTHRNWYCIRTYLVDRFCDSDKHSTAAAFHWSLIICTIISIYVIIQTVMGILDKAKILVCKIIFICTQNKSLMKAVFLYWMHFWKFQDLCFHIAAAIIIIILSIMTCVLYFEDPNKPFDDNFGDKIGVISTVSVKPCNSPMEWFQQ